MNDIPSASAVPAWRIQPQGDRCLLVYFGDGIDIGTGRLCLAAARLLRQAQLPGVLDVVPSFVAVAVHYRPVGSQGPRYPQLAAQVEQLLAAGVKADAQAGRRIEIPVCYGGEYGPDLDDVARHAGISPEAVVDLHTGADSLVFMLGFAPGAPYVGVHDLGLDIPRRASPRTAVPAGSVAVANRQSVLYPSQSPGGWNIIGATPAVLFDPARDAPTLLQPGDSVRFVPIDSAEYRRLREAAQ
ncbi:5-oxoprolinase subunit PxpB [Bordetella sp. BOR01]|uniref:5-oxoprolinase subunit PxpB n=1 Tax=Bordetella sp. BOR01 TaxID=2854779 RepID=UPI001C4810C2|nr:5-oxoprolinase subunit PxpB [Bordetella sp. BOR01]MBV7484470.1 5-oxoprolinase subunit PxpB [Bordetella sp. BOR01]